MSKRTARVTFGIPVFNGEAYLADTAESLLDQTYEDFELIILDNASNDATEDIGRAYACRDPRVRYVRNERNISLAPNFNKVFRLSSSTYFKWVACDDLHGPEFLERCVDILDSDPSVVLAHTGMKAIDEKGEFLPFDQECRAFIDRGGDLRRPDFSYRGDIGSVDVVTRFQSILHGGPGHETYGLIRSSALQKTSLLRLEGRLLLNELALLGRFQHAPEVLFFPRLYPLQPETWRERIRRQTGRNPKIVLHPWKSFLEYLSIIGAADITPSQKTRCAWALMQYAARLDSIKHVLLPGPNNYWGIRANHDE